MKKSTQKQLKEYIIDFLLDGNEHSIAEIKSAVEKRGIVIEKGSSKLRTALYFLKQEDSHLVNPEKGVYRYETEKKENIIEYDLTEFEHINASPRALKKMVVSILKDGTVAINGFLMSNLQDGEVEIRIKPDCSYLALVKNGVGMVRFGKNGRVKNYELADRISKKKKLPTYFVGEWDGKGQVWLGKQLDYNPNICKRK